VVKSATDSSCRTLSSVAGFTAFPGSYDVQAAFLTTISPPSAAFASKIGLSSRVNAAIMVSGAEGLLKTR
jgi:hypothetical protein